MQILIDRFPVSMFIGHLESEREKSQDVLFSLELTIDRSPSEGRDDLDATVDYGAVMNALVEKFSGTEVALLETVCDDAGSLVLKNFPRISSLKVCIEKTVLPTHITRSARVVVHETYNRGGQELY